MRPPARGADPGQRLAADRGACHRVDTLKGVPTGPRSLQTRIEEWDARTGGCWRYVASREGVEFGFHGTFHEVRPDRIVQTFTFEGDPDGVALETLWFEDLGDGRARLRTQSLVDSFEGRDAWLRSGMESGVNEGYDKLVELVTRGDL